MFHFKKFSIDDNSAAMKIGTDAVLLGSWVPCLGETRILDIGTGSGILALMMAQRNLDIPVDAVELNRKASQLAVQNAKLSPWQNQIQIFNNSIQDFSGFCYQKYSLALCNPPFFTNSLKSADTERNLARHTDTLPAADLFRTISKLLTPEGKACIIIPTKEFNQWVVEAAKQNLFPDKITFVKSFSYSNSHRVLACFRSFGTEKPTSDELNIYSTPNKFSAEYRELTSAFYLHF